MYTSVLLYKYWGVFGCSLHGHGCGMSGLPVAYGENLEVAKPLHAHLDATMKVSLNFRKQKPLWYNDLFSIQTDQDNRTYKRGTA